jgi:hypothetical protein
VWREVEGRGVKEEEDRRVREGMEEAWHTTSLDSKVP